MVDDNISHGCGLGSSASLVCGSIVTIIYSNYEKYFNERYSNCIDIAQLSIRSEHNAGVDSGGMDETICMLAQRGFGKHIEFRPQITSYNVKLPDPDKYCFIICDCLERHESTNINDKDNGTRNYNTRVVECRLATLMLAKALKIKVKYEICHMCCVDCTF